MEVAALPTLIADFLRARPEPLVAAWLYGSRARGTAGADSDVDVAVLLRGGAPKTLSELPLDLEAELERLLGLPAQVVVLNEASRDLVHRVLRDGILVCERDASARIAFEVRARNEYFDLEPVRRLYRGVPGPRGPST